MKNIVLVILILCTTVCSSQQVFEKYYTFGTWTRGNKVVEIPGEGYYSIGINDSLSFDSGGAPILDYYQGIIVKLDYNGDTLKTFQIGNKDTVYFSLFGVNSDDFFRSAVVTDDGNLLVAGETESYGAVDFYDYDLWLIKFDPNLNMLWSSVYSVPDSQILVSNSMVVKTNQGGFAIAGWQEAFVGGPYDGHLSVFDSLGNLLFHNRPMPQSRGYFMGAAQTSDNGFIITGAQINSFVEDQSPLILKTDSMGNLDWSYTLPYWGDYHYAENVIRTQDGNYIYVWENVVLNPGASHKVWKYHATKISEQGTELWTKEYLYSFDGHQRICELPNGNFMISGWGTDTLGNGPRALLMQCNSDGDSLWTREIRGAQGASPFPILHCMDGTFTTDGGYILTGETSCCNLSPIGWTSSLWVLKTDSLGLITSVINLPKPNLQSASLSAPYPNPTSDKCTITSLIPPGENYFTNSDNYLLVFDIQGRQLEKIKIGVGLNQTLLDISTYKSGEYLIALSIYGFNAGTKKIVKQ